MERVSFKMKKNIMVSLDAEVWLYYRMNDINISGRINEILRFQMNHKIDNKEEKEILSELKTLEEEQRSLFEKRTRLQSQLMTIKAEQEKAQSEALERASFVDKTIKASGQLQNLFD